VLRLGLEVCDVGLDFGLNPSEEHPVVYIEAHLYRPGPPARTEARGRVRQSVTACDGLRLASAFRDAKDGWDHIF
jgi:hypothetical protein